MLEKLKDALDRFAWRHLAGHLKIGPATFYGANPMHFAANAMHFAVNVDVPALGVTLCAAPPVGRFGWYFYASPNANPEAAVLGFGPGIERHNAERIRERLEVLSTSPNEEHEVAGLARKWRVRTLDPAPSDA